MRSIASFAAENCQNQFKNSNKRILVLVRVIWRCLRSNAEIEIKLHAISQFLDAFFIKTMLLEQKRPTVVMPPSIYMDGAPFWVQSSMLYGYCI